MQLYAELADLIETTTNSCRFCCLFYPDVLIPGTVWADAELSNKTGYYYQSSSGRKKKLLMVYVRGHVTGSESGPRAEPHPNSSKSFRFPSILEQLHTLSQSPFPSAFHSTTSRSFLHRESVLNLTLKARC